MSAKYFRSIGQQMAHLGVSALLPHYKHLPSWARDAITKGLTDQLPFPGVEVRKSELAANSIRNGVQS